VFYLSLIYVQNGFFLPLCYNSLIKMNAGDFRQADVFIGFRISHLSKAKKKPEKGQE
jgi:hypothetical protein